MKRTVPAVLAMATALVTLMASGCASKPAGAGAGTGSMSGAENTLRHEPLRAKNDCADFTASVKAGTVQGRYPTAGDLPPEAHPVSLLECAEAGQDVPGQGQWQVVNTIRSTGPVDGFVNALRAAYVKAPQPTPAGKLACPAIGYAPSWIALIDGDGTAFQIRIPMWGVCPAPDRDVETALAAVPTAVVATDRIRQTTSQGAQSTGCPQQFAEMAYVAAQSGAPGAPGTAARPFFSGTYASKDLHACFYKIPGAPAKNDPKPTGDFTTDATLTGSRAAAIRDGLTNAPTATDAKTCAAPATEYAVLFDNGGAGDWSVVELGGCKLAAPDAGADRQAPETVIQALVAATATATTTK